MKSNKKNIKRSIKIALIVCTTIIICLLFLLLVLYLNKPENQEDQVRTQEERDEQITNIIRPKGEKERVQIYVAEFLKHIEKKEYDEAYALLYDQFKKNYFPTISSFSSYAEEKYSDLMKLEYDSIERQGNYYILTVTITNLGENEKEETQKFIVYENGLNDYTLSFQAK